MTARSQAGVLDNKVDDIKSDLMMDIAEAKKPHIDHILKYFLYLVLDEDHEKKLELDILQGEIEALQHQRLYPQSESPLNESERQEGKHSSATSEASKLKDEEPKIKKRDDILQDLFDECLNYVLVHANSPEILNLLREYCSADSESGTQPYRETKRYAPFIRLCQQSLDQLEAPTTPLPFRSSAPLDLTFLRADPKPIASRYQGSDTKVERKPDLMGTSRAAASDILEMFPPEDLDDFKESCTKPPKKAATWEQVLVAVELKLRESLLRRLKDDVLNKTCDSPFQPGKAQPPNDATWESWPNVILDQPSDPVENSRTGSKRKRQVGAGSKTHLSRLVENASQSTSGKRRRTDDGGSRTSDRSVNSGTPAPESDTQKSVSARVQCASYGLEMLSHNIGIRHAINLLIIDDVLWIWYYDRQGIIQSTGISIIDDLPRFLVLLFAFQRFKLEDWGVIRDLNPNAVNAHGEGTASLPSTSNRRSKRTNNSGDATNANLFTPGLRQARGERTTAIKLSLDKLDECRQSEKAADITTVELNLEKFLSPQPHCLAGRATAVVRATGFEPNGQALEMVCKIYHPEVQRRNEGTVIVLVRDIAAKKDPTMAKHLPTRYFHGDMPGCTTHRIRSMVGILDWRGHRTTRIIGLKELQEITTLTRGELFLKAWLEVVTCHAFLWKHHVEHGDPSLSNMMYDPEAKCGVLTDFDLVLLQWELRIIGTDRTGTIPFMALELLSKHYWEGTRKRYYYHELESFLWMLPFLFLSYNNGERKPNQYIDPWRTSNYATCREKKSDFLQNPSLRLDAQSTIQPNYKDFWPWISKIFSYLRREHSARTGRHEDTGNEHGNRSHKEDSEEAWLSFVSSLEDLCKTALGFEGFSDAIKRLELVEPTFGDLSDEVKASLRRQYKYFGRYACK